MEKKITLLEENMAQLSHGTTGLITWQVRPVSRKQHVSLPGRSVLSHHGTTGLIIWQVRHVSRKQQVSLPGRSVLCHGTTGLITWQVSTVSRDNMSHYKYSKAESNVTSITPTEWFGFLFSGFELPTWLGGLEWRADRQTSFRAWLRTENMNPDARQRDTCIEKLHFIFQVSFNT